MYAGNRRPSASIPALTHTPAPTGLSAAPGASRARRPRHARRRRLWAGSGVRSSTRCVSGSRGGSSGKPLRPSLQQVARSDHRADAADSRHRGRHGKCRGSVTPASSKIGANARPVAGPPVSVSIRQGPPSADARPRTLRSPPPTRFCSTAATDAPRPS